MTVDQPLSYILLQTSTTQTPTEKKKETKKDFWRRKRKHTDCIDNDTYWHTFKRFARDLITAKHPFDKSLIEYSSNESGVGLKHVSKQTTTQPVCLSGRQSVYLSQRWSVFLSARPLVCLMLCYLKRHAGKITSNLKGHVTAIYYICLILPITRPYSQWNFTLAKKLLANDKISASFFNKFVFQALL